jgi:FkbM family methyltransferase
MNLSLIQKYFNPTHILDIGVHQAQFYHLARHYFPQASFFLIEGNSSCESLIKTLNVPYLIRVMGKEKGEGIFYKTKETSTSSGESLYREITPHFADKNLIEEKVQIHTIDTTFKEADFDLIKIDTQGSEIDILKGGQRICKNAKGILLETSVVEFNKGAPLHNDVVSFMEEYGFVEKECVDEKNIVTEYGLHIHQKDVLFVNKSLL